MLQDGCRGRQHASCEHLYPRVGRRPGRVQRQVPHKPANMHRHRVQQSEPGLRGAHLPRSRPHGGGNAVHVSALQDGASAAGCPAAATNFAAIDASAAAATTNFAAGREAHP